MKTIFSLGIAMSLLLLTACNETTYPAKEEAKPEAPKISLVPDEEIEIEIEIPDRLEIVEHNVDQNIGQVLEAKSIVSNSESELEEPADLGTPPPPPPPPPPVVEEIFSLSKDHANGNAMKKIARPDCGNCYKRSKPVPNSEQYEGLTENKFLSPLDQPLSTFSVDVDRASYSNARRFLNTGSLPPPDAVRIEEFINYFKYEYEQPKGAHPFSVETQIADCPWNSQHKLLHVGLQGKNVAQENLPPINLVFLFDVSGSMNQPNKLPLLKGAFKLLINQLRPQDRVAIAVYAGASGLVLPSTSGADKAKIWEALESLSAGGSTAGAAGIQLAYKVAKENFLQEGNNRVILATDGDFNVGMSSDAALVKLIEEKREEGVSLSVLGFGTGNYKDAKMEKLADNGNGNYAYIDNMREAQKVLVNEMGGTLLTIAKDVKLQLEFNPQQVKGYRLIGYENRVLQKEDFNNDKKDAGDIGAGHSVTALYELIPATVTSDEFLTSVDPLKYQANPEQPRYNDNPEWTTVKLRYKQPTATKSQLIKIPVEYNGGEVKNTSDNFRQAAALAAYGMVLKRSAFAQSANFDMAIQLAESIKMKDEHGYRKELVELMKIAKGLDNSNFGMSMQD